MKYFFLLLLSLVIHISAQENNEQIAMADASNTSQLKNTLTERIEVLEKKIDGIEQQTVADTFAGKSMITRCQENQTTFSIFGDFLYWKVQNNGCAYAQFVTDTQEGKGYDLHATFSYDPGVRLGIGCNYTYDGWDIYSIWTHIYHSQSDYASADFSQGEVMYGFWMPLQINLRDNPMTFFFYAKAKTTVDYHTVDLLIDRDFFIGKALALKPVFGLKATFLEQKFDIVYADPAPTVVDRTAFPVDVNLKMKRWAIGTKLGCSTSWYLAKCFYLYGSLFGDLSYGQGEGSNRSKGQTNIANVDYSGKTYIMTPCLHTDIGITFNYCIDEITSINLHAAWECLYYWDQYTQFASMKYVQQNLSQPLFMQGLTAGLELRF